MKQVRCYQMLNGLGVPKKKEIIIINLSLHSHLFRESYTLH